jgi:hypothetical protein
VWRLRAHTARRPFWTAWRSDIDAAIRAAKGEFLARAAQRTLKLTSDLMTSACSAGSYLTRSQLKLKR